MVRHQLRRGFEDAGGTVLALEHDGLFAFAGGGVRDVQPRHAVRPWRELPVHPAANALCGEGLGEGKACDAPGPAGASLAPQGRGMADTPPPDLPGLHGESCTSRPVRRGDASLPGSQHKHPLQHHPDLQDTGGHRAEGVVLMPAPAVDHHRRFCHGLLEKLHPDHCPTQPGRGLGISLQNSVAQSLRPHLGTTSELWALDGEETRRLLNFEGTVLDRETLQWPKVTPEMKMKISRSTGWTHRWPSWWTTHGPQIRAALRRFREAQDRPGDYELDPEICAELDRF